MLLPPVALESSESVSVVDLGILSYHLPDRRLWRILIENHVLQDAKNEGNSRIAGDISINGNGGNTCLVYAKIWGGGGISK